MAGQKQILILATPFGMGALIKNTAIGFIYAEVMQRSPVVWWRDWCLYFDKSKRDSSLGYNAFHEFFEEPIHTRLDPHHNTDRFYPPMWDWQSVADHSGVRFDWHARPGQVLPEDFEFPGSDAGNLVFTHYKELNTLLPKIPEGSIYYGLSYSDLLFTVYHKYFRPKKIVTDAVEKLWSKLPANTPVFGIHYRSTDKKSETPIASKSLYLAKSKTFLRQYPSGRVFVATDCQKALRYFAKHLGPLMFCANSIRSEDGKAIHTDSKDCIQKGIDILVDCYLLARCKATAMNHDSNVARFVVDILTPSNANGKHKHVHPSLVNRSIYIARQGVWRMRVALKRSLRGQLARA